MLTTGSGSPLVKPAGPVQAKVTPGVAEKLPSCSVPPHSRNPPVALTSGGTTSRATSTSSVAVQPVPGSVMVRVYSPASQTIGACSLEVNPPGPDQLYWAVGTLELPARMAKESTQVIVWSGPASAVHCAIKARPTNISKAKSRFLFFMCETTFHGLTMVQKWADAPWLRKDKKSEL